MSAICDTHKKKVGIELLYNSVHRKFNQFGDQMSWGSDELEIRCGRENQHQERLGPQAPSWAAQENGKETWLWPIEWGSICCSSVRFPTPSHTQPFQIKWEVNFSKNCVACHLYCVMVMIMHADIHMCLYSWSWWWLYNNCISICTNTLEKSINPSILPSIMGK